MGKEKIAMLLCAVLTSMILVNCRKDESARDRNEGEIQTAQEESAAEESKENADEVLDDEEIMEESLDAVESEEDLKTSADYNSDLSAARSSEKGSMDTLSGRYYFSKDGQVLEGMEYVFMDDFYTITETGSYSISPDGITIKRGPNPETAYKVEAVDTGYNLTNTEGNMIPLEYKEGTDGLSGSEPFDGTYSMGSSQGYIFHENEDLEMVNTDSLEVEEGTVSMGGIVYEWKPVNEGIEISTNGTVLYTFIPA